MVGNPLERMLRRQDKYDEPQSAGIPDLPIGYAPDPKPAYIAPPPAASYQYPAQASIPAVPVAPIQSGAGMRIGVVVSEFNFDITYMMLENAREFAGFLGASVSHVVKVPGVFDMPLAIKKLLKRGDVDGVVTLGAVIEGETDHDQIVIQHASRKAADLSLEYEKPVALGITGPGMTRLQAQDRVDRAKAAVESVVKMWQRTREL